MKLTLNTIIIPRISAHENTIAVLTFEYKEMITDEVALALFSKSVTTWVKEQKAGMNSYIYSSEDYNIGDLSSDLSNTDLIEIFSKNGLKNVEITSSCNDLPSWNYDTLLVNSSEISEDV